MDEIAKWLEHVRFRRKLLGGVNEADVWKKIREMNQKYEELLKAERIRYDTLLEEYRKNEEGAGHLGG